MQGQEWQLSQKALPGQERVTHYDPALGRLPSESLSTGHPWRPGYLELPEFELQSGEATPAPGPNPWRLYHIISGSTPGCSWLKIEVSIP